jgi:hypothetical protein
VRAEISYDLVMEDEMSFVEGTYRLPGGEWQVFIFIRQRDSIELSWRSSRWKSGATGLIVRFPSGQLLNKAVVESTLSEALGVTVWAEVRGPDSMQLR